MKMYKTTGRYHVAKIEEVEVLRTTAQSVFFPKSRSGVKGKEDRHAKHSDHANYFETWEEAKEYLMDAAENKLSGARRQLELAQAFHGNVKGMKP